MTTGAAGDTRRRLRRARRERSMVPDATFTSYYGRPVVKASPWGPDIPTYLFLGGVAGASSLLAAGSDLTGDTALRRPARVTALVAIMGSFGALVHDLGRPARFHHMLRVAKPTSPMSVGTWILAGYGPMAGLAAVSEARDLLPAGVARGRLGRALPTLGRAAGLLAAALGPAVAAYTAVLLADTATPTWHGGMREMPFVFVGSAAAGGGGMAMLTTPLEHAAPARRMAVGGALLDLAMSARMESSSGIAAEPMRQDRAGRYRTAARVLTAGGAAVAALWGRRSRIASAAAGGALVAGSACTRFAIFHAGQQSARDPRYTVVPQRERLEGGGRP